MLVNIYCSRRCVLKYAAALSAFSLLGNCHGHSMNKQLYGDSDMRYRFYREHKFVIPFINDVTRLIAVTDFRDDSATTVVQERVGQVLTMLEYHAEHEDTAFHTLLEEKGSDVHKSCEDDHKAHAEIFSKIKHSIQAIIDAGTEDDKVRLGYDFYLMFRGFEADNMRHINLEETVVMPELQRFYTDEQLRAVEAQTYEKMTPDEMVHMMQVIFPHMNPQDHLSFLTDIAMATPDKVKKALCGIFQSKNDQTDKPIIAVQEAKQLMAHFSITHQDLEASGVPRRLSYLWEDKKDAEVIETTYDRKAQNQ
jgi:hemerythrin-like domain-containing protein